MAPIFDEMDANADRGHRHLRTDGLGHIVSDQLGPHQATIEAWYQEQVVGVKGNPFE